ncbi:MAG: exodeoxyribonuclease V subunit alpha [Gammaproteobacteria bacterium]
MKVPMLSAFLEHEAFTTLDRHFAIRISERTKPGSRLVGHAAAVVSAMLRRGHLCARLDEPPDFGNELPPLMQSWPSIEQWRVDLEMSGVVALDGTTFLPLVLDSQGRLYLHRYFEYEQRLANALRARVSNGRFKVIVGGPGTGKTTRILEELTTLQRRSPPPRIALVAPTGKAAKRMEDSVRSGAPDLPKAASTLHRLLGARRGSAFFKHHASNPLNEDIVIVDEASMVDLPLMAKLLDALKPSAELILVGDPDQLASVEAGAVLADIAEAAAPKRNAATPLGASIVTLKTQYRYGPQSGIGQLCEAIRIGDGDRVVELLDDSRYADIRLRALPSKDALETELQRTPVISDLRDALALDEPGEILSALGRSRVLCPTRPGLYGLDSINTLIENRLASARRTRPVVLTRNDHALQLFNGDSGLIMNSSQEGESWAWFQGPDATARRFPAVRLPPNETAYAMTVHRSQGSEFDRVLVILPGGKNHVITRELLYTAISRARREVEIWSDPQTLREACSRKVTRHSGLVDRLR